MKFFWEKHIKSIYPQQLGSAMLILLTTVFYWKPQPAKVQFLPDVIVQLMQLMSYKVPSRDLHLRFSWLLGSTEKGKPGGWNLLSLLNSTILAPWLMFKDYPTYTQMLKWHVVVLVLFYFLFQHVEQNPLKCTKERRYNIKENHQKEIMK